MRLKELENELGYGKLTDIQREIKLKSLVGIEIEMTDGLVNITEDSIGLWGERCEYCSQNEYDHVHSLYRFSYRLYYDREKFGKQLITYSPDDVIRIRAKIKSIAGHNPTRCEFDLLSIVKVNTADERQQAREEAERKKREAESGCFIATVCYGNYDSPEVLILRQFRNEKLLQTFFGKAFVKFYYSVSPYLATLISKSELLKKTLRRYFLGPIVIKLQRQNRR